MPDPRPSLSKLIAIGAIDAELAALVWLMAQRGVPLTVAALDAAAAREIRAAIAELAPNHQSLDIGLAGGTVTATSLEQLLNLFGGASGAELDDAARDLGVVLIHDGERVSSGHYIRPVERDGAGHLQRRPPALLSAWNAESARMDHFYWAITDELATRAGMDQGEFEDERRRRVTSLSPPVSADAPN